MENDFRMVALNKIGYIGVIIISLCKPNEIAPAALYNQEIYD